MVHDELAELRQKLVSLESLRNLMNPEEFARIREELERQLLVLSSEHHELLTTEPAEQQAIATGDILIAQGQRAIVIGSDTRGIIAITGDGTQLHLHPDQVPIEALLQAYFRSLVNECRQLPLGIVDPRFLRSGAEPQISLDEIYIDLDVLAPVRVQVEQNNAPESLIEQRTPLLQALAHSEVTRFVVLGDPGSGKTTSVNHLVYTLAGETAGLLPGPSGNNPFSGMLPVRLILRDVVAHCPPSQETRGRARFLWDALKNDLVTRLGSMAAEILFLPLQNRILEKGALVLLDGLDEVPETNRCRRYLLEAVSDLATTLSPHTSRVIVTARPYAYADPRWRLPGFYALTLAPLNQVQIENFVSRWYQAVQPLMDWNETVSQSKGRQLLEALDERSYLLTLAGRPLLLTLMATLHSSWGQLPQDRAELYEETIKLLLSRWQRARETRGADGQLLIEPGIAKVLSVDEKHILAALYQLAYEAHRQQSAGQERTALPADINEGQILAAFAPMLPDDFNPDVLLRYLETRAGLLVCRAPGVYAFPHRSLQEYLAVCYLANRSDFAGELRKLAWQDPLWWREVFSLGVGKAKQGGLGNAVHIVNTLVPEGVEEKGQKTDTHWRAAILAGQALVEMGIDDVTHGEPDFAAVLNRVRNWLRSLVETADLLSPKERAEAGDILVRLGDPRPGIGVTILSSARKIPDVHWIEIPAGPFLVGSSADDMLTAENERPLHPVFLPAFFISRYPITNAQYRPFIEEGGYQKECYWTPDGWSWRTEEKTVDLSMVDDTDWEKGLVEHLSRRPLSTRGQPLWWSHPRRALPNRPVIGITFYEAIAYCNWLQERLQEVAAQRISELAEEEEKSVWEQVRSRSMVVTLPSEAEWEKAARGSTGYRWPWGNEWIAGRANIEESGIGETCAVGIFPGGMSPYGVMDVIGNVRGWTRSSWGHTSIQRPDYNYPYNARDGRENLDQADLRVVRGTSWSSSYRTGRCARRDWYLPMSFNVILGFWVVLTPVGQR